MGNWKKENGMKSTLYWGEKVEVTTMLIFCQNGEVFHDVYRVIVGSLYLKYT